MLTLLLLLIQVWLDTQRTLEHLYISLMERCDRADYEQGLKTSLGITEPAWRRVV